MDAERIRESRDRLSLLAASCASVGIEHGMSQADTLSFYLAQCGPDEREQVMRDIWITTDAE